MLRSLREDGFSVPLIVELALGPKGRQHDTPVEDRHFILELYRKELDTPDRISALFVRPLRPAATNEATFANFVSRWPDPLGATRDLTSAAWRQLTAAEQAEAINRIDAWVALRRTGGFTAAGPALLYLRDRSWRRTPDHFDPQPTLRRSS